MRPGGRRYLSLRLERDCDPSRVKGEGLTYGIQLMIAMDEVLRMEEVFFVDVDDASNFPN